MEEKASALSVQCIVEAPSVAAVLRHGLRASAVYLACRVRLRLRCPTSRRLVCSRRRTSTALKKGLLVVLKMYQN